MNVPNNNGRTPLCLAATKSTNIEIIKLLIDAGANINFTTFNGKSPMYYAIVSENNKAIKLLCRMGAKLYYRHKSQREKSPIFVAIIKENLEAIEYFCDHGADLYWKSLEGFTPLMFASMYGFDHITNYLSVRSKNLDCENKDGLNVLSLYVLRGNLKFASKILIRGADINYKNKFGKTLLYLAIAKKVKSAIIEWLLEEGANPHIEDPAGIDCCDLNSGRY